jgi:branched-chain amino acid transport system ATP-binding protein
VSVNGNGQARAAINGTVPAAGSRTVPAALELKNVTAGYGDVRVLRDVSIEVPASTVVAVLGPNGAGKTTLLRTATGLVQPSSGHVHLAGENVTSRPAHALARRGFCLIPEGRGIFPSLTVRENLVLASPRNKQERSAAIAEITEVLPVLGRRLRQVAGSLSGGEQQMLALGRAMVSKATLVAVDEASLGLAPPIVDKVYEVLRRIVVSGAAVILVEQYIDRAIAFADSLYVLNKGSVVFSGHASGVTHDDIYAQYLGS